MTSHHRSILFSLSLMVLAMIAPTRGHPASDSNDPCHCAEFRIKNGWCGHCRVGFVASFPVSSYLLFEALDAHGHEIDPKSIRCASCRQAMKKDGFCDVCNIGFIDKLAYVSQLTYQLARGVQRDPDHIVCATCRQNATRYGWCKVCVIGMVGNVAYVQKSVFETTVVQIERLFAAMKKTDKCEYCAVARFTGARCIKCDIDYANPRQDGRDKGDETRTGAPGPPGN
ncbi:MAG: hypothetical protein ACYTHJ_00950 [Planctomycetota bacterium]|jgi:hypothetical protein